MAARTILIASDEGIATLTLNRPEARNALDLQMREEIEAVLVRLRDESSW